MDKHARAPHQAEGAAQTAGKDVKQAGDPLVSIVVTAYNVADYLKEAVESVMAQTYRNLECVIVEDCSTDEGKTLAVCEELEKRYSAVRLVKNAANLGAGLSRRAGIMASKGDYVLTLDGDDFLGPDFIAKLVAGAKETGAEIVSGGITILRDGTKDGAYDMTSYGTKVYEGVDKVKKHFDKRIIFLNNKLVARRLHVAMPYCHRRYIEDTPVVVPMLYLANKVAYVEATGYYYRMQDASLTHTASPLKTALYRALCADDLIRFFADKGEPYTQLFGKNMFNQFAHQVIALHPSAADVAPFGVDWTDFSTRLLGYIAPIGKKE